MEKALTNFFIARLETETEFAKEFLQLLATLKERYKEIRSIGIAHSPLQVHSRRHSLLYYVIVLFNMKSRRCVFIRVQCDATIYSKEFDTVPLHYQTAESLLHQRFQEHYQEIHENPVDLEWLIQPRFYPFESFLEIERPEPVPAS